MTNRYLYWLMDRDNNVPGIICRVGLRAVWAGDTSDVRQNGDTPKKRSTGYPSCSLRDLVTGGVSVSHL